MNADNPEATCDSCLDLATTIAPYEIHFQRLGLRSSAFICVYLRIQSSLLALLDSRRALGAFAEKKLLDLAGGGLGQWPEDHGLRRLEARHARAAELDDLLDARRGPLLQLDERARRLAPLGVGLRDHRGHHHRRVAVEHVLDFLRG